MRRSTLILLQLLGCLLFAANLRAERATLEDLADSVCGEPGLKGHLGLTAIQRLPPVRIVVFDPVSNSFAFVACEPDGEDPKTISNQDYLDRRRLALSTQKIRLFILPYNPADGDLTLEKVEGEGVEFDEIPGADFPTRAQQTTASSGQKGEEKKEDKVEDKPKEPVAPTTVRAAEPAVRDKLQGRQEEDPADQYRAVLEETALEKSKDPWAAKLAVLSTLTDDYLGRAAEAQKFLDILSNEKRCVRAEVDSTPIRFTRRLAEESAFSVTHDVTLKQVREEAKRRLGLLKDNFYNACTPPTRQNPKPTFDTDILSMNEVASDVSSGIRTLKSLTDEVSRTARLLSKSEPPNIYKAYLESFGEFVQDAKSFNDSLKTGLDNERRDVDQLRTDYNTFQQALSSPAMQIQRFNYNPLANGKSITFTVRRGSKKDGDGDMIPGRVNKLELKSAPVYTMRFGMGLIASQLENPSFKVADFPVEPQPGAAPPDPDAEPQTERRILFDDEGNGKVLPGLFLHHYWGRKSPLLRKTAFETFMPTISLGIPISEANVFTQFLLGLDWEVTTGFEINVGYHFGKVNTLADGRHVGDVLPAGVDITAVQNSTFDSAFYFGVVVNRDAFERIFKTAE